MTTKEWLNRARNIDREINSLMRERRRAYDRCLSITSRINAATVSGTRNPHRYDALVEYEEMIDRKIDELYEIKCEIHTAISGVQDATLREVLRLRYIDGKKFEQIAVDMHYSWRQIIRLHGQALQEITVTQ